MAIMMVLSFVQVEPIINSKKSESDIDVSLDLGLTTQTLKLQSDGVLFPDGQKLAWEKIKKVYKDKKKCYLIHDNNIEPIMIFSKKTNWVRTLYPTKSAPTTLVSGTLMHRIKDTDPISDTFKKVRTLEPLENAVVLDTATGLGYTAIALSKKAQHVTTIELDPAAIEIARLNPWSQELFDNPKITQVIGNTVDEIKKFDSGIFTHVLHDPPMLKLGGELYSEEFYRDLFRVLKYKGKLFHYIGDLASEYATKVTKGILNRLHSVGFKKIDRQPDAFGIVAIKY